MLYNSPETLESVVKNTQTVILKSLKTPDNLPKNTIKITPKDNHISTNQIREIISMCVSKQTEMMFFVIEHAELMRPEAQNAFLKLLEEPRENYHFLLLTTSPNALLPTIRSRATILAQKTKNALEVAPEADKAVFEMAKRILTAKLADYAKITDEIAKKKPEIRKEFALSTLETAIELAYKSYFKTNNLAYVKKIPKLIAAYDGISKNGNLKLQFFANLI